MRVWFRVALIVLFLPVVLPAQSALPTPASVFGFEPGTDNRLATFDKVVEYFRRVDAVSDRVMLVDAGTTSQNRRFVFALVSSPANLRNIDRLREINRRLAHPASLTDAEAAALAREGKAFVHIDGGLHSTEVAGAQQIPLLLYDILRHADEPATAKMLDDVVLMLWPTINPDGLQMVAENQEERFAAGQTGGRGGGLNQLYQEYVGHDNNRDAYMLNMVESRALEYTWRQWEPQIIYVHHQASSYPTRIWLPPFAEPIARYAPYIQSRQLNMIGMAIAYRLEQEGKVGATHMGTGYDAWYPGYIDYLPVFKNISAFWTETQGNGAGPDERGLRGVDGFPPSYRDLRPQSLYPSPWEPGIWHLRDAVDYMETASMATIEFASKYREQVLLNRYRSGRDQIARGRQEGGPYGWIIPQDQRDPVAAVELLRRLAFAGVRIYQYREESTINGLRYGPGTWVVPADQEFAALAREVLEVQSYPDLREFPGGPPEQPYDAAGWTLPLSMGVNVITAQTPINQLSLDPVAAPPAPMITPQPYESRSVADAAPFDSAPGLGFDAVPAAKAIVPPAGRITGAGRVLALDPAQNNTFKALTRTWKAGLEVRYRAATASQPARYLIPGLSPGDQDQLVRDLALRAERTNDTGTALAKPRIGLFDRPTSMDHGWTRWVLDMYGFEYVPVTGDDLLNGNIADKVDVLLITDEASGVMEGGGRGGRGGGGGGRGRGAGAGAAAQPDPNDPNVRRVKALDAFIRAGGRLVCFNRSSNFAISQLELPVDVEQTSRNEFFTGTSLLKVLPDTTQPVMAGMPEEAAVFYDGGPIFQTTGDFQGAVLARYPAEGSPLLSGYMLGESFLQGHQAALDVRHGQGDVVLLGFRPQWRGQPFGTFKVIFNALIAR
ncbi:MAG: M14 family zinc carboxypeptidase [Vicinamibacterales bacterium]